jgi:hypothetical protein
MAIPRCAASAEEAIALVREHRAKWLRAAADRAAMT